MRGVLRFVVIVVVALAFGKWALFSALDWNEARTKNPVAVAAGFADHNEMDQAAKAGFKDPAAWRSTLALVEQTRKETEAKKANERIAAQAALAELNRDPIDRMDITTVSWKVGGFGTVGVMTVTIANSNDFAVKDISVRCSFDAKSGTQLSEVRHTIYDTIKPKARRTFKDVNIGFIHSQSHRGACALASARRTA